MFSDPEIQYLESQPLARIATVSKSGQTDVTPVVFEFNGKYFWIGSIKQEIFNASRRVKNISKGNRLVSVVVDDLESINPWRPRGIKVDGMAEVVDHNGRFGQGKYLRLTPKVSWSWGISGLALKETEHRLKTDHE